MIRAINAKSVGTTNRGIADPKGCRFPGAALYPRGTIQGSGLTL